MRLDSQPTVFTVLGVPWKLTPAGWYFLPTRLGLGLAAAFIFLGELGLGARLGYGVCFAVVTVLSQFAHIVGHTLGAQSVGAPMAANLILGDKILTRYLNDPPDLPARVHLWRTLGGPLMNLVIGVACTGAAIWLPNPIAWYAAAVNFGLFAILLLPIPGLDGAVVWRLLLRRPVNPTAS